MSQNTIESLCFSRTQGDLWDELNKDTNLSNTMLHIFPPDALYTLRLLGPFVKAKRIYTGGLSRVIHKMDIKSILYGNKDAYDKALQIVDEYFGNQIENTRLERERVNLARGAAILGMREEFVASIDPRRATQNTTDGNPHLEARTQLSKIYGENKYWQECILVNALCQNRTGLARDATPYPEIKIVALSNVICDRIGSASSRSGAGNCKINGLFAHSIELRKTGQGLRSQYEASLLPETNLSQQSMSKIVSEGLYDIPTAVKEANKKRYPFLYNLIPDYKMSTELMSCIIEEHKKFEEGKHIDLVEERINEIPPEAFEQANNMRSGIGRLEV